MTIDTYPKLTGASTDSELIRWWISRKAPTTQKTYLMVVRQFGEFTGKELKEIMLEDIMLWLESFQLRSSSVNTINNKLAAVKSLFSFGVKTGYLSANPASLVKSPKPKDALNERILIEAEVKQLIEAAKSKRGAAALAERDRSLIKLIYFLGLRVSELVGLNWSDLKEIDGGALVTVFGKGSKTRVLLIDETVRPVKIGRLYGGHQPKSHYCRYCLED